MMELVIPKQSTWNEETEVFDIKERDTVLQLEHSLISLSKWESIWGKPFLDSRHPKTREETISYIKCMTINQGVDQSAYNFIRDKDIEKVNKYIDDKMTATWFNEKSQKGNPGGTSEMITSELVYYWMIDCGIPFSAEKWHLNRLLTLIRICKVKGSGKSKMSQKEILQQNAALNAARRAKH